MAGLISLGLAKITSAEGGGWEFPAFWAAALLVQFMLGDGPRSVSSNFVCDGTRAVTTSSLCCEDLVSARFVRSIHVPWGASDLAMRLRTLGSSLSEFDLWSQRYDASWIDRAVALVIMTFDVHQVHGFGDARHLIKIAQVTRQLRIVR